MNQTMLRAAYVSNSDRHDVAGADDRRAVRPAGRSTSNGPSRRSTPPTPRPRTSACCTRSRSCPSCTTRSTPSSGPRRAACKDIYVFLLFELVGANVDKDAARVATCRELVVPLRDAWTEAAGHRPDRGDRIGDAARDASLGSRPRRVRSPARRGRGRARPRCPVADRAVRRRADVAGPLPASSSTGPATCVDRGEELETRLRRGAGPDPARSCAACPACRRRSVRTASKPRPEPHRHRRSVRVAHRRSGDSAD